MGAWYQEAVVEAGDARGVMAKYRDLVAEAEYMSGHGGYTGTFAEKHELVIVNDVYAPIDEDAARHHCQDANEKWGPSFAYYLGEGKWYIGGFCSS